MSLLVVALVGSAVAVEPAKTDGACGADTERARDDLGLRATGKQIRSSTSRERVRLDAGLAQTVTRASGSLFSGRSGRAVGVVAVEVLLSRAVVVELFRAVDDDDI